MRKSAPIVIVEDDVDDQEAIAGVMKELKVPNELKFFDRSNEAYDFLKQNGNLPSLIICDINIPGLNGIELKRKIDNDPELRRKSIPFVFLSTAAEQRIVTEAFTQMTVQGFFQKPNNLAALKQIIQSIIGYWNLSMHPNSFH